jgi:hypothetical protein
MIASYAPSNRSPIAGRTDSVQFSAIPAWHDARTVVLLPSNFRSGWKMGCILVPELEPRVRMRWLYPTENLRVRIRAHNRYNLIVLRVFFTSLSVANRAAKSTRDPYLHSFVGKFSDSYAAL